jgi:signal transduction histidine kinase
VTIKVRFARAENAVYLTVKDNGVGLSSDRLQKLGSHGLGSMRHRMLAIGGQFKVVSAPGQGTEIEVMAPLVEAD